MSSHEFYEEHIQKMVARFLWLRSLDRGYARQEFHAYLNSPNCPCPDVEQRVKEAWSAMKKD
jgi:hypothetical protein